NATVAVRVSATKGSPQPALATALPIAWLPDQAKRPMQTAIAMHQDTTPTFLSPPIPTPFTSGAIAQPAVNNADVVPIPALPALSLRAMRGRHPYESSDVLSLPRMRSFLGNRRSSQSFPGLPSPASFLNAYLLHNLASVRFVNGSAAMTTSELQLV